MHKTSASFSAQDIAAENRLLRQQLKNQTEEASHNEAILKRFHERELTLLASEGYRSYSTA